MITEESGQAEGAECKWIVQKHLRDGQHIRIYSKLQDSVCSSGCYSVF